MNSLLGDKLTAFAPRTIGILYHPLRKTDIAKQLFDVGVLFDAADAVRDKSRVQDDDQGSQLSGRLAPKMSRSHRQVRAAFARAPRNRVVIGGLARYARLHAVANFDPRALAGSG